MPREADGAYSRGDHMDRYSEMLKAAIDRGEPLDASLAALRQQGASIIDSVKAVREANLVSSLSEAKRLVEASSAWEGGHEARRPFIDQTTAPHDAFSQTAGIRLLTIRDALWLTVVVLVAAGMYAAWQADRAILALRLSQMEHRAVVAEQKVGEKPN
jgi:hypothetical protein